MNNDIINEKHHREWVNGSGVDPEIVKLNVKSLSGSTPHEYLLYSDELPRRNDGRLSTGYLRRYEHCEHGGWYCSGVDLLTGDESMWGCFKPNNPRRVSSKKGFDPNASSNKLKTIKYEHPPKVPTEVFALKVPIEIALKIAARYNVPLPVERQEAGGRGQEEQFDGDSTSTNCRHRADGGVLNPKAGSPDITEISSKKEQPPAFCLLSISDQPKADKISEIEFWQWIIDHPEIPIIITEGAKKAGVLLTAGYCVIALPGIYNGYRQPKDEIGHKIGKPHLIPQLEILAQQGRQFYFAFDSDSKIKTIINVNKAIEKTAKLLEQAGCTCKVIEWSYQHKGVDDLIVAKGVETFNEAYQKAKPMPLWKVSRLKQLTYKVAVEIDPHLRYLPKLDIPLGVKLIGIKARKGRGKTYSIEDVVADAIHEGRRVLVLSHRRQLVASLCDRFGLDNINGYHNSETNGRLGYGLCTDSLRYQSQAKFKPCEWEDALVIIDEVEQVLWHTLAANTQVRNHRVEILRNLQEVIEVVLSSELGQVLVADADLSDVSLDYIRSLGENPPEPYIIHQSYDPTTIQEEEKWQIFNYDHTNPKRLIADLIEHIRRGGKPIVCVSAQKMKSLFGTINLETMLLEHFPLLKILRIDSQTITDPEHPAYGCIEQLNKILPNYDVVLSSPSIETGVSIDIKGHFTSVWGIAGGVSADNSVCQALSRVRENIPRYLWVAKTGCNRVGNGTTNVNELVTKQKKTTAAHIKLLLESEEYELHGINTEFQNRSLWCWARMAIRINLGMIAYRQTVLDSLAAEGHSIHNVDDIARSIGHRYLNPVTSQTSPVTSSEPRELTLEDLPPSEFVEQKNEEVKHLGQHLKQLSVDNCQTYHREVSQVEKLNDRAFEQLKRRQNRTTTERLQLHKTEICRKYHVEDVSPELVTLDCQGVYSGIKLHYYLSKGRAYMKHKERKRLERMLELGSGCLFSPDFNRHSLSARIWLYEFLDFLPLLQKTQVSKDDPDLQRLAQVCKQFAADIKSILNVTIHPDDSPVVVYRKLREPLGLSKLVKLGRFGSRGDRHYTYANPDLTEREELFERWLAAEDPLPTEDPSPVEWAMTMLHHLESPARSFVDSTEANKFLKGLKPKLTSVLDEVQKVCSDFVSRFWKAFELAIVEV